MFAKWHGEPFTTCHGSFKSLWRKNESNETDEDVAEAYEFNDVDIDLENIFVELKYRFLVYLSYILSSWILPLNGCYAWDSILIILYWLRFLKNV